MKTLVFVKQVPGSDNVKLDPKTGNLIRDGIETIMNPLDANAVETAIQLKEQHGGTVSAITMGPPQAEAVLKRAAGMGCDDFYLLSDRAFGGADTLATAYVLAKAAEKISGYDLLIFGRHATDAETAQTGPAVASFLGLPLVSLVSEVKVEDGWAWCKRNTGEYIEQVKVKLPAVITVNKDINSPRFPNVMKTMKKKPSTVWGGADLECDPSKTGIPGSPSVTKRVVEPPKRNTDTTYFSGSAEDIAQAIVGLLEAEHLV